MIDQLSSSHTALYVGMSIFHANNDLLSSVCKSMYTDFIYPRCRSLSIITHAVTTNVEGQTLLQEQDSIAEVVVENLMGDSIPEMVTENLMGDLIAEMVSENPTMETGLDILEPSALCMSRPSVYLHGHVLMHMHTHTHMITTYT